MKSTLVCSATIAVGNHRCVRNWDWVSSLPFPHFPCPKLFLSHDPVGKQTTNSSSTSQSQLWLHQQKCFQSLWWWLFLHGNFNALWLIPKQAYLLTNKYDTLTEIWVWLDLKGSLGNLFTFFKEQNGLFAPILHELTILDQGSQFKF